MKKAFLRRELIIKPPKPYSTRELFELINPNISEKFKPLEVKKPLKIFSEIIVARGLHNYTNQIWIAHNKRNQFCRISIIQSFEGKMFSIGNLVNYFLSILADISFGLLDFRGFRGNWAFAKELGKEIDKLVHSESAEEK